MTRQIVLDTETTGLTRRGHGGKVCDGHRIIEIACVELIDRKVTGRQFHRYVNPGCKIDPRAVKVHGITDEFLEGKPSFDYVVGDFLDFVGDGELIIHNAPFDVAFLDQEFTLLEERQQPIGRRFRVLDTLAMARWMFPGVSNTLQALCVRYEVASTVTHGALLDALMLAHVYLRMTD